MGRWLKDRGPLLLLVGAGVALGIVAWVGFAVLLPRAVASAASAALGVPVSVVGARPVLFPLRMRLTGVRLGDSAMPTASAARVYVASNLSAWVGGGVTELRIEVWGPRLHATAARDEALSSLLRKVAQLESGDGFAVDSIRVDESNVEMEVGRTLEIAGFQLSDVRAERGAGGGTSVTAELSVMSGTGRVVADVDASPDEVSVFVGVEVDEVSLQVLARIPDLKLEGRAAGRAWYEFERREASWTTLYGGDVVVENLGVHRAGGGRISADRFAVDGLRIDPDARALDMETLDVERLALSPELLVWPSVEPLGAGWDVGIAAARVESVRLVPAPEGPEIVGELLVLSDVDTRTGTGAVEVEASVGEGRLRVDAERLRANRPGSARVRLEEIPLANLPFSQRGDASLTEGKLAGTLDLVGPPGLSGTGTVQLHHVKASRDVLGDDLPLLVLRHARIDAEHLSFFPPRLRLRRALIDEPEIWARRDTKGWSLPGMLLPSEDARAHDSLLGRLERRLAEVLGVSPQPTEVAPPTGVRLENGEIHVVDVSVEPPFRMRLRQVHAIAGGPAGTEGPLSFEAEARGPLGSRFRLDANSSTRGSWVSVGAADAALSDFNGYVRAWTGLEATGGSLNLESRARLWPDPSAVASVALAGVRLEPSAGEDRLAPELGAPFPEVVHRLGADADGVTLWLEIPGEGEAPGFGFGETVTAAFVAAVAAAERPSEQPAPELP